MGVISREGQSAAGPVTPVTPRVPLVTAGTGSRAATPWPGFPPAGRPAVARQPAAGRALDLGLAERRAILLVGDLVVLLGTLLLMGYVLPKPSWLLTFASPDRMVTPESVVLLASLWVLASVLTDCYDLTLARSPYYGPLRVAGVVFLVHVGYALVPIIGPPMLKSSLVWGVLTFTSVITAAAWRLVYAAVASHPVLTLRALIAGDGESGRVIAETLLRNPGSGHVPVAFVSEHPERVGTQVAGLPVVGTIFELSQLLSQSGVEELIVATEGPMIAEGYRAITLAYEAGVRVVPMATLYERVTSQTPVQYVGDHWLAVMPQPGEGSAVTAFGKRIMDVAGGLVGLVVLLALALPLALAIRVDSRGSVLFSQERIGRGGRRFRIYKLRTLPVGSERNHVAGEIERGLGAEQTIWERKATRPTRVGRWLRKLRLDELPQFWNILVGDMSLVGPRPFVEEDVEELQRSIPFFRCRLLVRPGLTGWAQVKANYGATPEDELAKLQYDVYYIRHQSLAFDVAILIKTLAVMLRLAGR